VKKRIDPVAVLSFLLTVAYFVAAAKGHGHGGGQLKGFFNGG
jgi:hypothetical protein